MASLELHGEPQMKRGTTGRAEVHVEAPPGTVYDLVSDVTRMGEWSPECVQAEWLNGATGPFVGAKFRGRNRRGLWRWSTKPRVVAAERGREFSFVAPNPFGRDATRWTYRLQSASMGTDVTETFEMLRDVPLIIQLSERWFMGVKDRKADLEASMRKTLLALKAAAEAAAADRT